MKNLYVLLFICCLIYGCSNDSVEATTETPLTEQFASKPEANPMFDNSYKGIYKGVVIGEISGVLYVNIFNDNQIQAKLLTDDNKTFILDYVPMSDGDNNNFTDPYKKFLFGNGNITLEIKLDETGGNISIPNFTFYSSSNSKICIKKETSNSLIKCFTGKFSNDIENGSINFTSDGTMKIKGISHVSNTSSFTDINGHIGITFPIDDDGEFDILEKLNSQYVLNANLHVGQIIGILDNNHFEGSWMLNKQKIGIWNAKRTL